LLKVYDILGKEVSTIVNAKQNAGSYTVEFNGKNLASGIYYYKLEADDFSEVRKMILLK
jgi:flagellar hook assembly protein FlgD